MNKNCSKTPAGQTLRVTELKLFPPRLTDRDHATSLQHVRVESAPSIGHTRNPPVTTLISAGNCLPSNCIKKRKKNKTFRWIYFATKSPSTWLHRSQLVFLWEAAEKRENMTPSPQSPRVYWFTKQQFHKEFQKRPIDRSGVECMHFFFYHGKTPTTPYHCLLHLFKIYFIFLLISWNGACNNLSTTSNMSSCDTTSSRERHRTVTIQTQERDTHRNTREGNTSPIWPDQSISWWN